jgi:hypothetical protein
MSEGVAAGATGFLYPSNGDLSARSTDSKRDAIVLEDCSLSGTLILSRDAVQGATNGVLPMLRLHSEPGIPLRNPGINRLRRSDVRVTARNVVPLPLCKPANVE